MLRTPARHILVALALVVTACGDDPKPDKAAPEITIAAPTDGAIVSAPLVVSGTVTDPKVKGRKRSGVDAVTVQGVAATLTDDRFEATLDALEPGPLTIVVAATDKAGNAAQRSVTVEVGAAEPPVTALHVEPPYLTVRSPTEGIALTVLGFFETSGSRTLVEGVTFEVADPDVVTVSAAGEVMAASPEADGATTITVRYQGLSATVSASARIDTEPPGNPELVGYAADTAARDQTWTGVTEPDATLVVDGTAAAAPIEVTANASGRFWINVPLHGNRVHDIGLTVTDAQGNASRRFPYPIRQSDGFVDAGSLHISSARRVVGFVGEPLAEPLVARAYDPEGRPRAGAAVTFEVFTGGGALVVAGGDEARTATVLTDGDGYARVGWRLGDGDYDLVEVHAALAGDNGFPVVFTAEGFARLGEATTIRGVVYDESRVPVAGLPVTLLEPGSEYASETRGDQATTDERGRFTIAVTGATSGGPQTRHLRLDGTGLPEGARHVRIDDLVTLLPGQATDVGTFWIPRLPEGVAPVTDAGGVVTEELVLEREVIPGNGLVRVRVPVGTKITWPGGVPASARRLALLAIPESRTPMSLPDGFFSREVLALQPGGTRFEPPLPLDLPNSSEQPPGSAQTLWSYDHFQSRFVPIGRGIVSADGTRVVSEPGSGIRVGAWHKQSPPEPEPPCNAKGQTIVQKIPGTPPKPKKKQKCKCYLEGTDQPTDCPEDEDGDGKPDEFVITNIPGCKAPAPPPPPDPNGPNNKPKPKPPTRKVEVVCEEEPLEITAPTELEKTIKKGDTVAFKAECRDGGKSNGAIKWKRTGEGTEVKTGTGASFTIKFDAEGTYTVSASADTKTCKGADHRVVKVKACAETLKVRVCGDTIEQVGPAADLRWRVSGNVKMGLKGSGSELGSTDPNAGDLYLHVGRAAVVVDPAGARPTGISTLSLDVGWPLVGVKHTTILASTGLWNMNPEGVITAEANTPGKVELLKFSLGFKEITMLTDGVVVKTPKLDIFRNQRMTTYKCLKPKIPDALEPVWIEEYHPPACKPEEFTDVKDEDSKDLEISIDAFELRRTGITPNGVFEYKPQNALGQPGIDLIKPVLKLMGVKLAYQKARFSGELALQASVKAFDLGIKTSATWGEGFFSGELNVSFGRPFIGGLELPGIPIFPATIVGPIYLTSLGLGYESTGWPVSDGSVVKLKGTAGLALGPSINVLGKRFSLARGLVETTFQIYPTTFSAKGTFNLFEAADVGLVDVKLKEDAMATLIASVDLTFDPNLSASVGGSLELKIPPLAEGVLGKGNFGQGEIKGSVKKLAADGSMVATLTGGLTIKIPKTRISPEIVLYQIKGSLSYASRTNRAELFTQATFFCGPIRCTAFFAADPFNGATLWVQTQYGDTAVVFGTHPTKRVSQIPTTAPGIGVSAGHPMTVAYTGDPIDLELLEPADALEITVTKAPDQAMQGELFLPSGARAAAVADPIATETRRGVDYSEGLDGQTVTWIVYGAEPGTYTFATPNDAGVIDVTAYVPPAPPTLAFAEPFERVDGDLVVAWTGAGGADDAGVTLYAEPVGGVTTEELGVSPFQGARELVVDDGDLRHGAYRIVAAVRSFGGTTLVASAGVYVLGAPEVADEGAPGLARARWEGDDLVLSWLPVAGADAYEVSFVDDAGVLGGSTVVRAPGSSARLTLGAARSGTGTIVPVGEPTGVARVRVDVVTPRFAAAPPSVARVGATFLYKGCVAPTILGGPWGMTVDGDTLTWPPTASELGEHAVTVTGCGRESFTVVVEPEGTLVAPEPALEPDAYHVAGVVGEEVDADCGLAGLDEVVVTLASGPDGAVVEEGRARWTPDAATAIAGGGIVAITCRATSGTGEGALWTDTTVFVHFVDRDGDGLSDDFEVASGLDPDVANATSADGDDDGLDDAEEDALGTRGDVADSDGDGLDDGDETATSARAADSDGDGVADGTEVEDGTDPTKVDSDGDGLTDGDEKARGTSGKSSADADDDGLPDDRERALGTDPAVADSDGDGLSDGEEIAGWRDGDGKPCSVPTDPLRADSDEDGVDDQAEATRCDVLTRPMDAGSDQDGDGLRSDRERVLGTSDVKADTDGDEIGDAIEVLAGTDPLSPDDKPDADTVASELIAKTGVSPELVMAPESLTDFGVILVFADADGDGAADEYETTYAYDPESAADAYDDPDQDGLPMWREAQLGTNPRVADSDGDGVVDGQELQDGTDPNDGSDFSTAGPVTAVTLYPRRLGLQQHAFIGAATRQLSLVGARADGSTTDLTATARGTSYAVAPADGGTVDAAGVFTGAPGFSGDVTITATNLGLESASTIVLSSFTPGPIATLPLGGAPTAVAIRDGTAFVGGAFAGGGGVRLIDISRPEAPVVIGDVATGGSPSDLAAAGVADLVAAARGSDVVLIDERSRAVVAAIPLGAEVRGVTWAAGQVVAATSAGLARVAPSPGLGRADVDGDERDDRVVDVQAPTVGFTSVAADLDRVIATRADGRLMTYRLVSGGLVQELDLTPGATATRVSLRGGLVSGATGATASRLVLGPGATWRASASLGIVLHTAPVESFVLATESTSGTVAFLDARGAAPRTTLGSVDFDAFFPAGLAVDARYFYLADAYNQALYIGQHNPLNDLLGVPPVVVPVAPLAGTIIPEGTRLDVEVAATDDVGVASLALTRDDVVVAEGAAAPWVLRVKTSNVDVATPMAVGAFATDYGGNVGTMAPLVFTVTPIDDDTPPTLTLLEPSPEEFVASGSDVTVAVAPEDDRAVYAVEVRLGGALVKTLYDEPWVTEVTVPEAVPSGRVTLTVTAIDYGDNVATASADLVLGGVDLVAEGVTSIGADDATWDDQDILIRRGTVMVTGAHRFGKVRVGRDGVLTHPDQLPGALAHGLDLQCERVDVVPTGSIDVSGRGYRGDCAAGDDSCGSGPHGPNNVNVGRVGETSGGAHGGVGGRRAATYGSWSAPVDHGMGGDYGAGGGDPGGNGGGRVRLVVDDEIVVNGIVRASGASGAESGSRQGGGGAGGSIWIDAATLTGTGRIEAHGGFPASGAHAARGGAGGGGRVALDVGDASGFDLDRVTAYPGATSVAAKGGAGTVWLALGADPARLVIDDGERGAGVDDWPFGMTVSDAPITVDDLEIRGSAVVIAPAPLVAGDVTLADQAVLTHLETDSTRVGGLSLTADTLTIGPEARVDVSARGYVGDCAPGDNSCGGGPHGPGNVNLGNRNRSGGSHGGIGGGSAHPTYDAWDAPSDVGMGGDYGSGGGAWGGDGGGRVRLAVGALVVDGAIRADGGAPRDADWRNGSGGAGGAVHITATSVSGAGAITADGGASGANGANGGTSPGGGGRVAIAADVLAADLRARVHARPGEGILPGYEAGPGTVWLEVGAAPAVLVVDDDGRSAWRDDRALGWAASDTPVVIRDLIVRGRTRLVLTAPLEAGAITLEDEARLSPLETTADFESTFDLVCDDLVVGAAAAVDATGRGYLGDCAPFDNSCGAGAHWLGNVNGGARQNAGGSHGGDGAGAATNTVYGDPLAPDTLGAGGGYGANGGVWGGDGGGRLRITCDALVVDGVVAADGGVGIQQSGPNGAGAGGSVWITTGTLAGGGAIRAHGGGYVFFGGGGRVAVAWASSTFDPARITAHPGGPDTAAPGTVVVRAGAGRPTIIVDDGGLGGLDTRALGHATSSTPLVLDADLIVRGASRLALAAPIEVAALRLEGSSVLTHVETVPGYEGALSVTAESMYVGPDAAIDVSGRGYVGDCAPGDDSCGAGGHTYGNTNGGSGQRGGGSHGGLGSGPAGFVYGDPLAPTTLGAGGGYGNSGASFGADGGGRVRLVAQRLELEGAIRADGMDDPAALAGASGGGGGGGGGSVYVTVGELGGAGVISARGGLGGQSGLDGNFVGSGSGGGGRVAVVWTSDTAGRAFDVDAILARGGQGGTGNGGPGTVWLAGPGQDRLVVDNAGVAHVPETAPWIEVGARRVVEVLADGVRVEGDPWRAGLLAGAEVDVDGASFRVTANSSNTLTFESTAGLGAVAAGDRALGVRRLTGRLVARGAARVALTDRVHAPDVDVGAGAVLTHPASPANVIEPGVALRVTGGLTIDAGGAIDVSGRGYLGDCEPGDDSCGAGAHGPGNVNGAARQYSGGSHGGAGGGPQPGVVYGDPLRPETLGGGGGYGLGGGQPGARGGGRVHVTADTLLVRGVIRADGAAAAEAATRAGGGAGGAVLIEVDTLGGAGAISARGGDGGPGSPAGEGGGGGRVAIYWADFAAGDAFDVDGIDAHGGIDAPAGAGGPGTLWLAPEGGAHRLVVDNGGRANSNERAPWVEAGATYTLAGALELHGASRVALVDPLAAAALRVEGGAVLTHPPTYSGSPARGLWIDVVGSVVIAADGAIDVSARGYRGDCAAGDDSCGAGAHWLGGGNGSAPHSGGSFGGLGGGPGPNATYGGPTDVYFLGAGGGYGDGGGQPGGAGGGRVHLSAGALALDGVIRADGETPTGNNAAGGAGGGIAVTATTLTGGGGLFARGGGGIGALGGGGGGGRIHVTAPGVAGPASVGGGAATDGARVGGAGSAVRD
ncbi:MAG: hypothetical protein IT385_09115 [Deltaproteobacteria bacterium]|nr:hypothetical protein [Deltaproteobacteria bacterium]